MIIVRSIDREREKRLLSFICCEERFEVLNSDEVEERENGGGGGGGCLILRE